jgi:hypothetical protein
MMDHHKFHAPEIASRGRFQQIPLELYACLAPWGGENDNVSVVHIA